MLTEGRIKELVSTVYYDHFTGTISYPDAVEKAIRLAVAETAEACAQKADAAAARYKVELRGPFPTFAETAARTAAEIAAGIRAAAKGAK